jgi:hypothetical protein
MDNDSGCCKVTNEKLYCFQKNVKASFAKATEAEGGESGIRTLGVIAGTTVFETAPFDRSGNSPE